VSDCWHRYDRKPSSSFSANHSQFAPPLRDNDEPSILGSPPSTLESLWYPDSGASHHFTHDASTLHDKIPYTGSETVKIGYGSGLYIKHTGSADFINPTNHHIFSLNKPLHVPHIYKNLLNISQFAHDNVVFFEFHPHHCLVKKQDTKEILLQGRLRNAYMFS